VGGASSRNPNSNFDQDAAPASSSPFYDAARRVACGGAKNAPGSAGLGGPGLVVLAPTSGPASLVTPSPSPTASVSSSPSSSSTNTATASASPTQAAALVCPSLTPCPSCPAVLVTVSPSASPSASASASAARSPSPSCRPDLEPARDHCRCRRSGDDASSDAATLFCDPAVDAPSWCPSRRPRPTCHPDLADSGAAAPAGGADPAAAAAAAAAAGGVPLAGVAGACVASALLGAAMHAFSVRSQSRRSAAGALHSRSQMTPARGKGSAPAAPTPGDGLGRVGVDW
jgi:hypothetical protein